MTTAFEGAVEAAAIGLYAQLRYVISDDGPWAEMPEVTRGTWRHAASRIVTAAAPILRAEAWDEGFIEANRPFGLDDDAPNPYRAEQEGTIDE